MEKLRGLSHLFVTVFLSNFGGVIVIPAITDVTMSALCPGKEECSLAIYLSGLQQAIIGVGTMVMMPLLGNLSDVYGRKALLTIPMTVAIIPNVILGYSTTTDFYYAYYVLRTLTAMVSEGSVQCLALAYVADKTSEAKRVAAFGILSGVGSVAFLCGPFVARFLSPSMSFKVAAIVLMVAVVYMRIFLQETVETTRDEDDEALTQPILKSGTETIQVDGKMSRNIPSPMDIICFLKSSVTFSQAAFVAFFSSLAEGAFQATFMYFLKARFQFNKDQFADLMLIAGIAGTVSQMLLMPILAPLIGEVKMLSIGLFVGFLMMVFNSLAWSVWVPYVVSVMSMLVLFANPSLRSVVSKQVGPYEQGMAQGCISGITSIGLIISPLVISPLTALFLSEEAPFHYPGFSILCIGFAWLIAFILSTMIRVPNSSNKASSAECSVA